MSSCDCFGATPVTTTEVDLRRELQRATSDRSTLAVTLEVARHRRDRAVKQVRQLKRKLKRLKRKLKR